MALLLSDQRMPGMTGVEFLERAREIYPDARRVLLTAYADTDAAIQAINSARIHYYLNKPWDPPEEKLYPVLSDLLDDWKAGYRPPFEGLRVIGNRWSLQDHEVRSFLSRNQVPYRWMDVASEEAAQAAGGAAMMAGPTCRWCCFRTEACWRTPEPERWRRRWG